MTTVDERFDIISGHYPCLEKEPVQQGCTWHG
jgi:hypothetical protein